MRKVLWCCAALAIAVAGLCHGMAVYASRHPESQVGRCVIGAYGWWVSHDPVYKAASRTARQVRGIVVSVTSSSTGATGAGAAAAAETDAVPEAAPGVAQEAEEAPCPRCLPGRIRINEEEEVRSTGVGTPFPILPPGEQECEPAGPFEPPCGNALRDLSCIPQVWQVQAVEELDDVPPFMPPAIDEDMPTVMPHAIDAVEESEAWWQSWWRGVIESIKDKVEPGVVPEESEPAKPPECKEDPNYPYHYPGCPYTGACPYTGRCYTPPAYTEPVKPIPPACDPDNLGKRLDGEEPMKKTKKRKKKDAEPLPPPHGEEESSLTPGAAFLREVMKSLSRPADQGAAARGVDTMEFRRSDARPHDFEPMPY